MVRLNKIGVLSYGYIMAVISAIASFLYILIMFPAIQTIMNLVMNGFRESMDYGMGYDAMGSGGMEGFGGLFVVLLIVTPIVGAITGFIAGCLGALIYNIAAKWTGGVELNFVKAPVIDYSGKSSMRVEEEPPSFQKEDSSVEPPDNDEIPQGNP
jgi:hypothetical protein